MGKRGRGGKPNRGPVVAKGGGNTAVATKPTTPADPSVISDMMQAYNTAYGPNAPLLPYPGLQPKVGPRQFQYPIASNLNLVVRDNLTPFEILRQFASLYDGIRICQQSWFDCASGLEPDIVPVPGLLGKGESADKYADDIAGYMDFFESPDREHTIHEWMNAALEDLTTIDAVAMYPRLTYSGDLYSLDLIDGATIKPLLDDRGRAPAPPFYAYEQVVYGAPSELFTSDELLYLKEHNRTYSAFGFSRVENILMRVNQALRKQSLDMAMFTDGNIPAGFVSPAADLGWTPDQLQTFQTILDSLYAGNDALRSRLKMMPPGSVFTPTNPISVETVFDLFLFTVTCASFGTNPAEAGFTEDVNRASGETQADVLYRRTLKPIAMRFARLFNFILKKFFHERRFLFQWKGYEAAEDFGALVAAHAQLVGAGIEKVNEAAEALHLAEQGPDVPRFVMTKDGPFVVDDLANTKLRDMQVQSQMAGLQMAANPQQPQQEGQDSDEQPQQAEEGQKSVPEDRPAGQQSTDKQSGKSSSTGDAPGKQGSAESNGKATVERADGTETLEQEGTFYEHRNTGNDQQSIWRAASRNSRVQRTDNEHPVRSGLNGRDTDTVQDSETGKRVHSAEHLARPPLRKDGETTQNPDGHEEALARADLRKWRDMAVARVQAGKPLRPFVSEHIPQAVCEIIERPLANCISIDEVKAVFARAQDSIANLSAAFSRAQDDRLTQVLMAPNYAETLAWQQTDPDIQARLQELRDQGVGKHTWKSDMTACDACTLNDGVTVKVGEPFPSGALATPGHGHCVCETAPAEEDK